MRFDTTHWTVVKRASHDPAALQAVIEQYRGPIEAYVRMIMKDHSDAEDVAQNFVSDKLLQKKLLQHASETRGSFRSLLKTSIRNAVVDHFRKLSREQGTSMPTDELSRDQIHHAEAAFDEQVLSDLIQQALRDVEGDCHQRGMDRQWHAFEARVVQPARGGCEKRDIAVLVEELGARDGQEISTMADTVRKKLLRTLLRLAGDMVNDPADAPRELDDLLAVVAGERC